jgi:trimethylamine--corrinoid protein Co-methyltransferase
MMQGIEINEETLALEAIAAVGPGGNFLAQKHTRKHMRQLFLPQFMDRRPYNEWESKQDGAPDWAQAKARQVIAEHQPEPLDPSLSHELMRIIASLEN